ncbi:uncharacterized protein SCHCODRAFT_02611885 [Schizophyllum commune H4-8]|uniref:uncharacterized protein n=1 Tax=Schizophyllum commune (strain H4-8 / FGSC 9210) TaxID=578458 RepID=UPI00215F52AE|nr:uncharacterized protein SCHCODRAFT_02611885 [Schizophyllum commune H4-8]KAI5898370.1 hypothetical protein SCHCODRAFT_02611885 [Schizophyllum commune H4-8]
MTRRKGKGGRNKQKAGQPVRLSSNRSPSPISNLPVELLLAIFKTGIPISFDPTWYLYASKPLEVAVSQVCKLWRSITIDAAELWTVICVRPTNATSRRRAHEYAHRSRDQPVTVHVYFQEFGTIFFGPPGVDLLKLLAPRLRELILTDPQGEYIGRVLECFDEAPNLQRLEYAQTPVRGDLVNHDRHSPADEPASDPGAPHFPSLRHLKANHVCLICLPPLVNLVSLHVTNLSSDNPTVLAGIIHDCPALHTLVLPKFQLRWKENPYNATRVQPVPIIVAPSIKRFAAQFTSVPYQPRRRSEPTIRLSMPNLEYFELYEEEGDEIRLSLLFPAQDGSSSPFPSLHTLRLQITSSYRDSSFLSSLTAIRHLILVIPMPLPLITEHWWPILETLHVRIDTTSNADTDDSDEEDQELVESELKDFLCKFATRRPVWRRF